MTFAGHFGAAVFFCMSSTLALGSSTSASHASSTIPDTLLESEEAQPVDEIADGEYRSSDGYFGVVNISSWADEYLLRSCLNYGGYCFDTSINVTRSHDNVFKGEGMMTVEYTTRSCQYKVAVEIKAYEKQLFIRTSQPEEVYDGIVNNVCPRVSNVNKVHASPYRSR